MGPLTPSTNKKARNTFTTATRMDSITCLRFSNFVRDVQNERSEKNDKPAVLPRYGVGAKAIYADCINLHKERRFTKHEIFERRVLHFE